MPTTSRADGAMLAKVWAMAANCGADDGTILTEVLNLGHNCAEVGATLAEIWGSTATQKWRRKVLGCIGLSGKDRNGHSYHNTWRQPINDILQQRHHFCLSFFETIKALF